MSVTTARIQRRLRNGARTGNLDTIRAAYATPEETV